MRNKAQQQRKALLFHAAEQKLHNSFARPMQSLHKVLLEKRVLKSHLQEPLTPLCSSCEERQLHQHFAFFLLSAATVTQAKSLKVARLWRRRIFGNTFQKTLPGSTNSQLQFLELKALFLYVTVYFSHRCAQLFSKFLAAPESYGKDPRAQLHPE